MLPEEFNWRTRFDITLIKVFAFPILAKACLHNSEFIFRLRSLNLQASPALYMTGQPSRNIISKLLSDHQQACSRGLRLLPLSL